jgi:hypothetical protein
VPAKCRCVRENAIPRRNRNLAERHKTRGDSADASGWGDSGSSRRLANYRNAVDAMATTKRDGFYKQRGSKKWWCRDPVTGKRVSTGYIDKEAARRWFASRERQAADPEQSKPKPLQIESASLRFRRVSWEWLNRRAA